MNEITQRDNTRNQSTVDISHKHIFLFDNKFSKGVFNNNTGDDYTLKPGTAVIRDSAAPTKLIPAVAGATLVDIVGVISTNQDIADIADDADVDVTFCHGGVVNKDLLVLPDGVTFDTLPTGAKKNVGDIFNALGFELEGVVEQTKSDN